MLRYVKTDGFFRFADAQTDDDINDFQNHECADNRQSDADADADELIDDLSRISFDQTDGQNISAFTFENRVDRARRKNSGHNRAENSADAVNAENVQRVVITEKFFDFANHKITNRTGDDAEENCRHRCHKSGGGRDADQIRQPRRKSRR